MALKSTIFKFKLQIADMDRDYYQDHSLTIARHPSETDERMMVRVLAFALEASEQLQFTKGLCADDEPEIWQKELSGDISHWIDLGLPDEKRVRRACSRAEKVTVYCYGGRQAGLWWDDNKTKLCRFEHLRVINLPKTSTDALAAMVGRTMQVQVTIQDGHAWFSDGHDSIMIEPEVLK